MISICTWILTGRCLHNWIQSIWEALLRSRLPHRYLPHRVIFHNNKYHLWIPPRRVRGRIQCLPPYQPHVGQSGIEPGIFLLTGGHVGRQFTPNDTTIASFPLQAELFSAWFCNYCNHHQGSPYNQPRPHSSFRCSRRRFRFQRRSRGPRFGSLIELQTVTCA